ncbi:DUF6712 family protein [Flagellimonas sp.]|uniref:DUF6712 family protein n=1 Tax=Flagellimonas sp. TaxID=2058762 RepID=UPI003BAD5272
MATLLKTIQDVKKYVAANASVKFDSLKPYIIQADRKFVIPACSQELYTVLEPGNSSDNKEKVYELLREASAHLAMFLYIPIGNVEINDHGIIVESGESSKAAEWWQIRDLRRSFLESGLGAIDDALKIMEANEGDFDEWKGSDSYTLFMELFVKRTDTFNRWFNISNSRRTFLALRPYMLEAHHQYFVGKLGKETVARINFTTKPLTELSTELAQGVPFQVMGLMQASLVNYTVAKAIDSGMFEITPSGIYQKLDDFPGQKTKTLNDVQINRLLSNKILAGEEFFKKAIDIIELNPLEFPEYTSKESAQFIKPMDTKSTVSF